MRRAAECLAHLPVFGRPPRLTAARCCRSTGCASSAASSVRPWDRSGSGAIREGRQKRACGFAQRGWHACSRTCGTAKNHRRLLNSISGAAHGVAQNLKLVRKTSTTWRPTYAQQMSTSKSPARRTQPRSRWSPGNRGTVLVPPPLKLTQKCSTY